MTYRLLVTGSRTFAHARLITDALTAAWLITRGVFVLVHGACPCRRCLPQPCCCNDPVSADAIADAWARRMGPDHVTIERHPAKWREYGKPAGFIRNAAMVERGADDCYAFFEHGAANTGTTQCSDLAEAAGIPVTRWWA